MNIYIDESGPFIPPKRTRRYSLVLALVIPSSTEAELFYQFLRLRDSWPQQQTIEIKGSKLDEHQAAEVMLLLAAHGVIAEYNAIDMSLHPDDIIDEFKQRQAAAITANLTPEHAEVVVRGVHEDADAIRNLANPLFVQAFLSIDLSLSMIDVAINYYAQRRPEELGRFAWVIDRKDRSVTEMERLWSTLMLPIRESRSSLRPYAKVEGFDYTHFAKYEVDENTADDKMKRHLKWMRETLPSSEPRTEPLRCIDAKRLWTAERAFEDSANNLGLQLADITATTLCRALNGNLQPPGWEPISRLLIRKKTAPFSQIGKASRAQHPPLDSQAEQVWRSLDRNSQAMVVDEAELPANKRREQKPLAD
jgi:hypothetical protein